MQYVPLLLIERRSTATIDRVGGRARRREPWRDASTHGTCRMSVGPAICDSAAAASPSRAAADRQYRVHHRTTTMRRDLLCRRLVPYIRSAEETIRTPGGAEIGGGGGRARRSEGGRVSDRTTSATRKLFLKLLVPSLTNFLVNIYF